MTMQELRTKRASLWDEMRNFLDMKRSESGTLSEADSKTYDAMEQQMLALGKEIQRLEQLEKLSAEMAAPTTAPMTATPGAAERQTTASKEYSTAFWNSLRRKPYAVDVLEVGTDSKGGYLVPDEFEKQIITALEEENFFRTLAHVITTSNGDHEIPVATAHGTAAWMAEGASYTDSDETFGQVTLGAHKLGTTIKISEELMNDSVFDLSSYTANEFARRIGAKEEEGFLVGDGNSKPVGIFDATNGGDLGYTTTAAALTFDDVMELYHSLKTPYRKKAVWVLNDSTIKGLRKIKDSNGNYIWQPSLSAGIPDTILNRPYYTSAYAPTLAAGKTPIAFGDLSYYWIADRQKRSFKRLNELFAMSGQVGFLASERVDGRLVLKEAVKLLKIKP